MGNCSYCSRPAGMLRSQHQECEEQHQRAEQCVIQGALQCVTSRLDIARFANDKNLYFASRAKSFRVPFAKIVVFTQFSNGIGIMRDTASAKPQIFVTRDSWCSCNLITMLAQQ